MLQQLNRAWTLTQKYKQTHPHLVYPFSWRLSAEILRTLRSTVSVAASTGHHRERGWSFRQGSSIPGTDKEREMWCRGNPHAMAGTHEVGRSLLWLKSKSIPEAHEVMGFPSRRRRTGPFSTESVCRPHQLLQKMPCKTLVIWCADPTKSSPLECHLKKF